MLQIVFHLAIVMLVSNASNLMWWQHSSGVWKWFYRFLYIADYSNERMAKMPNICQSYCENNVSWLLEITFCEYNKTKLIHKEYLTIA